jgi:hypothetical protein
MEQALRAKVIKPKPKYPHLYNSPRPPLTLRGGEDVSPPLNVRGGEDVPPPLGIRGGWEGLHALYNHTGSLEPCGVTPAELVV